MIGNGIIKAITVCSRNSSVMVRTYCSLRESKLASSTQARWFIITCNCKGSDALTWFPQEPHTHAQTSNTVIQTCMTFTSLTTRKYKTILTQNTEIQPHTVDTTEHRNPATHWRHRTQKSSHTLRTQNTQSKLPLSRKSLSLWLAFTVPEVQGRGLGKKSCPQFCLEETMLTAELTHSTDLTWWHRADQDRTNQLPPD